MTVDDLRNFIEKHVTNYPTAYFGRGKAYQRKGHYDRAIADYNKAIEINFSGTALPMTRY